MNIFEKFFGGGEKKDEKPPEKVVPESQAAPMSELDRLKAENPRKNFEANDELDKVVREISGAMSGITGLTLYGTGSETEKLEIKGLEEKIEKLLKQYGDRLKVYLLPYKGLGRSYQYWTEPEPRKAHGRWFAAHRVFNENDYGESDNKSS